MSPLTLAGFRYLHAIRHHVICFMDVHTHLCGSWVGAIIIIVQSRNKKASAKRDEKSMVKKKETIWFGATRHCEIEGWFFHYITIQYVVIYLHKYRHTLCFHSYHIKFNQQPLYLATYKFILTLLYIERQKATRQM